MKKSIFAALILVSLLAISVVSAASESKNDDIEKVTFIHYKKGPENRFFANITNTTMTSSAPCYKLMGVKWPSLPVSYVINPSNKQGLSSSFITTKIFNSAESWDLATSKELFNNKYLTTTSTAGVQNYKNTLAFGSYPSTSVIAVTTVWYNKYTKQIVEFDILFNTYFKWGDGGSNPNLMDLQNIATHEFGHSIGLSDLYNTCTKETMYGYSRAGETIKRTLSTGDIAGLRKIYS